MLNNKNSQFALLHEIFILDAHLASPLVTQNRIEITNNFINEFLQILGLEPLGDLGVFDAADLRAPGWSFIQPITTCLLYTSPSPRDATLSRMPSSA